jgi:ferredoxin
MNINNWDDENDMDNEVAIEVYEGSHCRHGREEGHCTVCNAEVSDGFLAAYPEAAHLQDLEDAEVIELS